MPPVPPTPSVVGDVAEGEELYLTCSACHGAQGEGRWATNSPRLAGQDDWYMVRQLQNFKHLVRGGDRRDLFGPQMALMTKMLRDEQAMKDVVAYINTLPMPVANVSEVTAPQPAELQIAQAEQDRPAGSGE